MELVRGRKYSGRTKMQAIKCDRCEKYSTGKGYTVRVEDEHALTFVEWELCGQCKDKINALLHKKDKEEK